MHEVERSREGRPWIWPTVAMVAALLPVLGVFSASRIFHVRDLSLFFWPRYLWLRDTVAAGQLPLWDPHAAAGQPAFADPLHQLFFPPTLLVRLLLPEVVGFNLWVALPLPLAALGAWLLFRGRVPAAAAALGALVFTYAGPVVSTLLYPNLSWSVALMPWVVWTAGRAASATGRGAIAGLACAVGLQALAGEPVTLAATLALAGAYVLAQPGRSWLRRIASFAAGVVAGVLLAAIQLVPLVAATRASARAELANDGTWSLHPLAALELIVPRIFGSPYESPSADLPWLTVLNANSDPLLYSLYIGMGALVLMAAASASPDRRMVRFWTWTAVVALVAAAGAYSPPYRLLQWLVPIVETFRFPVKYLTVAALAAGGLAAAGWAALAQPATLRPRGRMFALVSIAAIAGAGAVVAALLFTDASATPLANLAGRLGIDDTVAAAARLQASAPPLLIRLAALGAAGVALLAVAFSTHPARRVAVPALLLFALADVAAANMGLNPTMPVEALRTPAWVRAMQAHGEGRIYVGARVPDPHDIRYALDGSRDSYRPAELSAMDSRTLAEFQYAMTPSAWGVREVVSYDLPMLWPREYTETLRAFARYDASGRWQFVSRTGSRYCLVRDPFHRAPDVLLRMPGADGLVLYVCNAGARRAFIAGAVDVEADLDTRIRRLFDPSLPADGVVLPRPPAAAAGEPGTPLPPAAAIVEDTPHRVAIRADAGAAGGQLVLLDSFNDDWHATVDGAPATIQRANVLFRSVHIAPGRHQVEFRYRPASLYAGAAVSALALVALLLPWPVRRGRGFVFSRLVL